MVTMSCNKKQVELGKNEGLYESELSMMVIDKASWKRWNWQNIDIYSTPSSTKTWM